LTTAAACGIQTLPLATHPSPPGGRILLHKGQGKTANSDRDDHRVRLGDVGRFVVYRPTVAC
jgi:hypothetical protein